MLRKPECVDTVNIFFSVLLGCFLILAGWAPGGRVSRLLDYLANQTDTAPAILRVLFLILGGLVFAANLYAAWLEYRGTSSRDLEITGEAGLTRFSARGLEAQLVAEISDISDVVDPDLRLMIRGEGMPVQCRLVCKLRTQADVPGRADQLKILLRDKFLALIPTGATLEITIHVRDIVTDAPAKSASSSEFTGPVYPIDGDLDGDAS